MTRISGATQTESQERIIAPVLCVYLGVAGGSGDYHLTAHDSDLTIGGTTYTHTTLGISSIEERMDGNVTKRQVIVSCNEQDLLTVFKTAANYVGKPVQILDGLMQADGTILTTATWVGVIAGKSFSLQEGQQQLVVHCEDWFSWLQREGRVRFDSVSQRQRAPDVGGGNPDTFADNMPGLKGQHVVWMGKDGGPANTGYDPGPIGPRIQRKY